MVEGTTLLFTTFLLPKNQNGSLCGGCLTLEYCGHEDSGTFLSITCDIEVVESDVVSVVVKSKSMSGSPYTSDPDVFSIVCHLLK